MTPTRPARADLAREPDALGFPSRQGLRRTIQLEVVEADVVEKAQPLANLLEDAAGDLAARPR